MTKSAKLEIDITDAGYSFAELALSNPTNLSFGFDVTDGALTVYRQERGPFVQTVADISPKKLRKFARALLALADQVDPPAPAPVVLVDKDGDEWFETGPGEWSWGHGSSGEEGATVAREEAQKNHPGDTLANQTRAQLDNHEFAPFTAARPA